MLRSRTHGRGSSRNPGPPECAPLSNSERAVTELVRNVSGRHDHTLWLSCALRRGSAGNLWIASRNKCAPMARSPLNQARVRTFRKTALQAGANAQEASAFCFNWSNSAWLIAPLSSRLFADAIWSAGLLP